MSKNDDLADVYGLLRKDERPSTVDNRYEPHQLLGQGGMSKVYSAYDMKLGRIIALKLLSSQNRTLSTKEAQSVAKLKHNNVVTVFDFGNCKDRSYIAMEYIPGQNLQQYLSTKPNPEIKWIVRLVQQIAEAVHHAHREGIIHRDLKPANIMLQSGIPKIMDFGLAKSIDETTNNNVIRGTLQYMAPEQVQAQNSEVDQRTDIYALGLILYELLTKRNPFTDVTIANSVRIIEEIPPSLRSINKTIPWQLEKICLKCLAKNKKHRYQSARFLAKDLDSFANRKTRTLIYIPWVLFCLLFIFIFYPKNPELKPIKKQKQVKSPVQQSSAVLHHVNKYPIAQKHDWRVVFDNKPKSTSYLQTHAKFLLNYAMSSSEVKHRKQKVAELISVTKKAINLDSNDSFSRFLHYLGHLISTSPSLQQKANVFLKNNSPVNNEIQYYNKAMSHLDKIKNRKSASPNNPHLKQAFLSIEKGLGICKSFVFLYDAKATALQFLSKHKDVLTAYETALKYEPYNPFILSSRANYYYEQENSEAALADIQTLVYYEMTTAQTWYLHGRLFKEKKLYSKAAKSFTIALDLGYSASKCYFQRQSTYSKQGQYQKAINDCTKLLLQDKRKSYYLARAEAYLGLGRNKKAVEDLEAARKFAPNNRKIILEIANIYQKMGEKEKAREILLEYTK
ncbi:protein kinase [Candidatus Uabimicrobium sp. HlEnr_7]|uniref:protein kinase domain-containing protein n=1 Tax=Candidatus Uabimicrobium helgolandensis TaxID=3095367 RepID=UPI0035568767